MAENVVYLHGQPDPVGHFLRVGTSGHRQLEALLGSGRMMLDRVVLDASAVGRQHDLIATLGDAGAELILDTNVAELSSIGRFNGSAKSAPWANPKSVLTVGDLKPIANRDVIREIAQFAVRHGFHAIQAPTHILDSSTDPLFVVDRKSTETLRKTLDAEGGKHVGIDYPLMIKAVSLRDPVQRRAFIAGLDDLPFENLWLRVSGFGADATPMGLRRYIAASSDFHRLNKPVVSDGVGGLVGLAIAAFGAAGGLCHGVMEKERFDAGSWNKPPKVGGGGGGEKRLLVLGLDRQLTINQVKSLMEAPGARRLLSCNDPTCCATGLDDSIKDPRAHFLRQRAKQVVALSAVPEARRAAHFLDKDLGHAERTARQAAKLKVADPGLGKLLAGNSARLENMLAVLESLKTTMADAPRALPPKRRVAAPAAAASRKR